MAHPRETRAGGTGQARGAQVHRAHSQILGAFDAAEQRFEAQCSDLDRPNPATIHVWVYKRWADSTLQIRQDGRDAFAEAREKVARMWGRVQPYLTHTGDPARLTEVAGNWSGSQGVDGLTGAYSGWFTERKMDIDNVWKDDAASRYIDILPSQKDALKEIGALTTKVGSTLVLLAIQLEFFWWRLQYQFVNAAADVASVLRDQIGLDALNMPKLYLNIAEKALRRVTEIINEIKGHEKSFKELKNEINSAMQGLQSLSPVAKHGRLTWPTFEGGEPIQEGAQPWKPGS